ncbi:MAG: hypothetical protein ACI8Y7_000769 [Candidatus Woesearchaeota archaeon]|jgi:hypothetical protein
MSELVQLKNVNFESKVMLLTQLGLGSDGTYVLARDGKKLLDKYLEQPILIENMLILPGSTVVLDDNPLSIALYMEEYSNVF